MFANLKSELCNLHSTAALFCTLWLSTLPAAAQVPPGGYTAPNLETQFAQINQHGEPLGFNNGGVADNPDTYCDHYQGIARLPGPGTPYFFMTRSGNRSYTICDAAGSLCYNENVNAPGEFLVARMGSRATNGERLRSNKLAQGADFESTQPPFTDVCITHYHFDGTNGWPAWCHAGGMQLVDDVLFVPLERPYGDACNGDIGELARIDVSDPENPYPLSSVYFTWPGLSDTQTYNKAMGVVAVAKDPASGKYLILVTHGDSTELDFWETLEVDAGATTLHVSYLSTWNGTGNDDWTQGSLIAAGPLHYTTKWQMINFVRDANGTLYVVCTDNDTDNINDNSGDDIIGVDFARLFRVDRNGNNFTLTYIAERRLKLDDPDMGDFDAVGGAYVTPSGQLILYSGMHASWGAGNSIELGEFRNWDMNHTGTAIPGSGWITLYEEQNGWSASGPERSLTLDYVDQGSEDWQELDLHETFTDDTEAIRWAIPVGQCGRLYQHDDGGGDHYDLAGIGIVQAIGDFNQFGVSSVEILHQSQYPAGEPISLAPTPGFDIINLAMKFIACTQGGTLTLSAGTYNEAVYIANPITIYASGGTAVIQP